MCYQDIVTFFHIESQKYVIFNIDLGFAMLVNHCYIALYYTIVNYSILNYTILYFIIRLTDFACCDWSILGP